jgi:hypothetical protein
VKAGDGEADDNEAAEGYIEIDARETGRSEG